jgi:hypothetical protein
MYGLEIEHFLAKNPNEEPQSELQPCRIIWQ